MINENKLRQVLEGYKEYFPKHWSDELRRNEKILIIDAKYYGHTLQKQFDKYTLHSGNVYQIFTYVKNQDRDGTGDVAGLLLYAKTDESITPDCSFNMGGNRIGAKTLDLNVDFPVIAAQLDGIAREYLGAQQQTAEVYCGAFGQLKRLLFTNNE